MVALVIVGIALPALLLQIQAVIDNATAIKTKTYAYWYAENKLNELIIDQKLQGKLTKTKKKQDRGEFVGQEWFWKVEVEQTALPKMFRIEVSVGLDEDTSLATISGFTRE